MKALLLALYLGNAGPQAASPVYFNFDLLHYGNAPASASKARLVKLLGPPLRISQPHYACGFLSASEQQQPFYSLVYGLAIFTGNARRGYVLDRVRLLPGSQPLRYGKLVWSAATTRHEIERQFHVPPDPTEKPQPDGSTLLLIRTKAADAAMFIFKQGRLVEFQYWTPC